MEAAFSFDPSIPLENEKHERFCLEVLAGKANLRAYQLAYPEADYMSAAASSTRLLKDVKVAARLAHLRDEQKNRLKMTADEVLFGLTMAARFDPADLCRADGTILPIHDLPPEVRLCIEKIEIDEITVGEGENKKIIGRTAKVHAMSKRAAYEMLGRHHKLFTDKLEVTKRRSLEDILGGDDEGDNGSAEGNTGG